MTHPNQLNRGERSRVLYIEKKSGHADDGPAWIGRVRFSKSGSTLYYRDLKLRTLAGRGIGANYFDVETREQCWVSGVKKDGSDRHWAGGEPVHVDEDVAEEYRELRR